MSDKHTPGPDPRSAVAGPHTTLTEFSDEYWGSGMPGVGAPGLGYALPARPENGNIYARPFTCTSVKSDRQLVTGWVFIEPGDSRPTTVEGPGVVMLFVRDIRMGNPAEPDTVHWLKKNYAGRSDSQGLTPAEPPPVTEEVPADPQNAAEGQQSSPQAAPEPAATQQETWQRLGFASKSAWKEAGKPQIDE